MALLAAIDRVWPELSLSWRSLAGTVTGFLGAAVGSAGGVGGGSIFVPTANLILGFDTKSSTALSKCMIMGATLATFGYNLTLRHPYKRHSPLVDYDMAVLLQPMLLLGISIGVIFNTVFPTWILTLVLISIMIATGFRTSQKAVQIWKRETIERKEKQKLAITSNVEPGFAEIRGICKETDDATASSSTNDARLSISDTLRDNIKWENVAILFTVWAVFSALQILQSHFVNCSAQFWILNALQIPFAVLVFSGAAIRIYRKNTQIRDEEIVLFGEKQGPAVTFRMIVITAASSCTAGVIAGLVGLGGGFAIGPLLLEFGAHPQVVSATATFIMLFSSSMSVLEYYLLSRFPVSYALYLLAVSIVGGVSGQYVMDRSIKLLGRASIIIFLMTFLSIFSALVMGGLGIDNAVHLLQQGEYMGFLQLC